MLFLLLGGYCFEFDGVYAAVRERFAQRAVHELVLLDERLAGKRFRSHGDVEMVHRARAVHDAHFGVGNSRTDQLRQRAVVDHDFRRGECPELSASARPRASPSVSGRRVAPLESAIVTPLATRMPVTPTKIAGTPLARNGPTSIVKVCCTRARPRKKARRLLARLFIA